MLVIGTAFVVKYFFVSGQFYPLLFIIESVQKNYCCIKNSSHKPADISVLLDSKKRYCFRKKNVKACCKKCRNTKLLFSRPLSD
jgi:hypothetical protein